MSKQIIVSNKAHAQLCDIAKVLKISRGKSVTFADVIDYLLDNQCR